MNEKISTSWIVNKEFNTIIIELPKTIYNLLVLVLKHNNIEVNNSIKIACSSKEFSKELKEIHELIYSLQSSISDTKHQIPSEPAKASELINSQPDTDVKLESQLGLKDEHAKVDIEQCDITPFNSENITIEIKKNELL